MSELDSPHHIFVPLTNRRGHKGRSALHVAACAGQAAALAVLLQQPGVDLTVSDGRGWRALHEAAHEGHEACCVQLLAAGADKELRDKGGATAAMLAMRNNAPSSLVDLLLPGGASVNIDDI